MLTIQLKNDSKCPNREREREKDREGGLLGRRRVIRAKQTSTLPTDGGEGEVNVHIFKQKNLHHPLLINMHQWLA